LELRRYWSIVKKKLWMIALVTIVSCTAVGYYSNHFLIPQYEASAKLIVNQNSGLNAQNPALDMGSISSNILLIKTYKEVIQTPRIMGKVVQQYPELHATVDELSAKVSVSSVNETQVMSVSARDYSYERAAKMANAVSNVFQQEIRPLMKLDNVSILNWADPSERRGPVSPHPIQNIVIAFVLASMVGIALAFLLDQLDDTVKTEKDIRTQLGLPLLAAIPKMKSSNLADRANDVRLTKPAGGKKNVTLDA
jgi:capsular polysaccharide biosynthesis protein